MAWKRQSNDDNGSDGGSDGNKEKKLKTRKPPNTAFRQQRLLAYAPILTPKTVLPLFFAVGIIFGPIGGLLLFASSQVLKHTTLERKRFLTLVCACRYKRLRSIIHIVLRMLIRLISRLFRPIWYRRHSPHRIRRVQLNLNGKLSRRPIEP